MDNSMQIHLARIYLPFAVVEDRRIIVNKNIFLKNNFVALLTFTARYIYSILFLLPLPLSILENTVLSQEKIFLSKYIYLK